MGLIPTVISFDVEPHGFQTNAHDRAKATSGYDAMVDLIGQLRPALEDAAGVSPRFGWFFRMDPQIASAFGRADHLVSGFGSRAGDLLAAGDHVGLHTHPLRWSDERGLWVHDIADAGWIRDVIGSSFEAFSSCFGVGCERHRMGAGLYTQEIVDALERAGARVDVAFEPTSDVAMSGASARVAIDESPIVGTRVNCAGSPREPYTPQRRDFRRSDPRRDGILLVPLTTSWLWSGRPAWQTVVGALVKRRRRPLVRSLYPVRATDAADFWDLVARQVRVMSRPYLNFGFRTDDPDSPHFQRMRSVLEALPRHPIAGRLAIVDPMEFTSVARPAETGGRISGFER